jgi:hypothetical protein
MQNQQTQVNNMLPSVETLQHAARFALKEDKPILLDYYRESLTGKAFLGEYRNGKRFLLKSESEYTSNIVNMGRSGNEFICITENSIYICSSNMKKKIVEK